MAYRQGEIPFAVALQNPSGAGRTERVVAPLDVCCTQGEPHSPQLASSSEVFAFGHLRACLADIIAMPVPDGVTTQVVQLLFWEGGWGLRSAARLAPAAYRASWADC